MRKLQYLFMTLAALCFAMPAFADTGSAPASLIPIGIPAIFLGMHLGVSVIQAFVFMLLAMIYLAMATAHEQEAAI